MKYLGDEGFQQAVKNKQYYFLEGLVSQDKLYTWGQLINQIDNHPESLICYNPEKLRINLNMLGLHAPKRYCIDMLEDMETIFVNNHCTLIAFIGISKQTKSYGFHRDVMDVLYVQDQGSLEMGLENDQTILMKPGDGLWIPRGRGHDPKPLSSRCGMSFGVEGDPDPCTYL